MSSSISEPFHLSTLQALPTHIEPFIHDYARARFISTLNPSRLLLADYHIISNSLYSAICPRMLWPYEPSSELVRKSGTDTYVKLHESPYKMPYLSFVGYTNDQKGVEVPFPRGIGGFFYYHQPPAASPASGQLRFRITPSSWPGSWASGVDLHLPNGLVWKKSLLEILGKHPKLTALHTLLLADGLISSELVQQCKKIMKWRGTLGPNILLFKPGQVFHTAFSAFDKGQFVVVGREAQSYVRIESFFRDLRSKHVNPYAGDLYFISIIFPHTYSDSQLSFSGSALCSFEVYDPPLSRTRRRSMRNAVQNGLPLPPSRKIVLRVLKIVDPVSCVIPNYDGFVNEPKAGELMMIGVGDSRRPWMYNVDTEQEAPLPKATQWTDLEKLKEGLKGLRLLLDYHQTDGEQ